MSQRGARAYFPEESLSEFVNITCLFEKLIETVNYNIRNGVATERGLARRVGISQPHMHNLLKGARGMTPETADRLLASLGLSVADLVAAPDPVEPTRKPPAIVYFLDDDVDAASR